MATKFLRKIILEELQKVLKEANMSSSDDFFKKNIADDGDSYTSGPSGKTSSLNPISLNPGQAELGRSYKTKSYGSPEIGKKSPKPGDLDFMGPEQPTPIPGSGTVIQSSPKRIATLKLQTQLSKLGFLDKEDIDGKLGPTTAEAFSAALGATGTDAITGDELKKYPVSDLKGMAYYLSSGNKSELQKIAAKYRAAKVVDPALAALGLGSGKKDSVSPGGMNKKQFPQGSTDPRTNVPSDIQKRSEEEEDKLMKDVEKYGTEPEELQESIAREIRKLLRSI